MNTHMVRITTSVICVAMLLAVFAGAQPQPALAATECIRYHTVKSGDTTPSIAHTYGLKWKEIALANDLKEPYKLTLGQVLCIPGEGAPTKPTDTAFTDKSKFDAFVVGNRVLITVSSLQNTSVFNIKVRDASVGVDGYYKLGTLKVDKNQTVTQGYVLPKDLSNAQNVTVCLKNATSDELTCKTVPHQ